MTPFFGGLINPQFAYADPHQAGNGAGETAGQLFVVLLLVLGIAKCWKISRHPGTSTKSILALACVLGSFFSAAIGTFATGGLDAGVAKVLVQSSAAFLFGVGVLA